MKVSGASLGASTLATVATPIVRDATVTAAATAGTAIVVVIMATATAANAVVAPTQVAAVNVMPSVAASAMPTVAASAGPSVRRTAARATLPSVTMAIAAPRHRARRRPARHRGPQHLHWKGAASARKGGVAADGVGVAAAGAAVAARARGVPSHPARPR